MTKRTLELTANTILIAGALFSVVIMFSVMPPEAQIFTACINPFVLAYLPLLYLFAGSPWLFLTSYGALFVCYLLHRMADKMDPQKKE